MAVNQREPKEFMLYSVVNLLISYKETLWRGEPKLERKEREQIRGS